MLCADWIPSARMTRLAASAGGAARSRNPNNPMRPNAALSLQGGFADGFGGGLRFVAARMPARPVLQQQARGDARPFEDHRKAAAGMGAAAHQVDVAAE